MDFLQQVVHVPGICARVRACVCVCGPAAELYYLNVESLWQRE